MIHATSYSTIWIGLVVVFAIMIWWHLLIIHRVQVGPEMMLNMVVLVLFGNVKNSVNLSYVIDHLLINLSPGTICDQMRQIQLVAIFQLLFVKLFLVFCEVCSLGVPMLLLSTKRLFIHNFLMDKVRLFGMLLHPFFSW
jgi:hypothetical protein